MNTVKCGTVDPHQNFLFAVQVLWKEKVMASSVSLNLRVTTPGARKGEKRRPKGPEMITPHVGHNDSKLLNSLTKCASVEEQVRVVKMVNSVMIPLGYKRYKALLGLDPRNDRTIIFFQFFGSLPLEPPEDDLIQTVRCFFLLPKSSALRRVIVNCQAQSVDEHRRRLIGHFDRFIRQAVEDPQVPLPDYVLSCSDCGQDHPAKDAVKAAATLLAPAILVRNLIPLSRSL